MQIPEFLHLRDFFIPTFVFNASPSSESQPNSDSKHDNAQDQATKVTDEVTDKFPLAAEEIAKPPVQNDPGEFSERVIRHEAPEFDPTASGDQIDGNG